MCRFFAMRSSTPLSLAAPLCQAPTALVAQSICDRRGEAHEDGWGIAALEGGALAVHRSTLAAHADPRFAQLATSLNTTLAIAHVRQASVGQVSSKNTHPFAHGHWAFAHNGTLQNFAAGRARLLAAIPADLQAHIVGTTDSEHIFYLLLGTLRRLAGNLDDAVSADAVLAVLSEVVRLLAAWFPTHNGEETKLNFLVTDGRLIAATCWKHSLQVLDQAGECVMIASQPTSDGPWEPISQGALLVVDEQLRIHRGAVNA